MSTDPTPTSRAAEVLARHPRLADPDSVDTRRCAGLLCGWSTRDRYAFDALFAEHQAQALTDAGLLREQEPAQGGLTEAEVDAMWAESVAACATPSAIPRDFARRLIDDVRREIQDNPRAYKEEPGGR